MTALLEVSGISVSFDGLRAINNLSFAIAEPELRAIIGPNGAGKTTFMDIVTGKTRPDTGSVIWGERAINLLKLSEAQIARAGIGRKFQRPTVFEDQTVAENLMLALKAPGRPSPCWAGALGRRTTPGWPTSPPRSALPMPCRASLASCPTGKSNGWKSACCWPRSRAFCWWTSLRRA